MTADRTVMIRIKMPPQHVVRVGRCGGVGKYAVPHIPYRLGELLLLMIIQRWESWYDKLKEGLDIV